MCFLVNSKNSGTGKTGFYDLVILVEQNFILTLLKVGDGDGVI